MCITYWDSKKTKQNKKNNAILYLGWCWEVEFHPVKISPMSHHWIKCKRVSDEMKVLSSNLAGEDVPKFLLPRPEKLERVGPKLQGTSHIGNEPIFQRWFTWLPAMTRLHIYTFLLLVTALHNITDLHITCTLFTHWHHAAVKTRSVLTISQ